MHKPQSTSSRCSRHDTKHLRIVKRFVNARQFPAARRGAFGWSRKAGGRASQFKRVASVARFVFHFVNWQWTAHHLSLYFDRFPPRRAYNGVTNSAWKSTTAINKYPRPNENESWESSTGKMTDVQVNSNKDDTGSKLQQDDDVMQRTGWCYIHYCARFST